MDQNNSQTYIYSAKASVHSFRTSQNYNSSNKKESTKHIALNSNKKTNFQTNENNNPFLNIITKNPIEPMFTV